MNWVCELSQDAEKDLNKLLKVIQKRVGRSLAQMATDFFHGNVKALQGEEWQGVFRRRIGDYRLLFKVDGQRNIVHVVRILLRSGKTYR